MFEVYYQKIHTDILKEFQQVIDVVFFFFTVIPLEIISDGFGAALLWLVFT